MTKGTPDSRIQAGGHGFQWDITSLQVVLGISLLQAPGSVWGEEATAELENLQIHIGNSSRFGVVVMAVPHPWVWQQKDIELLDYQIRIPELGLEKTSGDHPAQSPCPRQGHLEQVTQEHIQTHGDALCSYRAHLAIRGDVQALTSSLRIFLITPEEELRDGNTFVRFLHLRKHKPGVQHGLGSTQLGIISVKRDLQILGDIELHVNEQSPAVDKKKTTG
ncbi:hypothetical protein HGM15179_006495 [Zosterops borbonicus]|uniref:Uncharacterized protein n=1 Tax=Zosterops borbonicus TaxID=364589 RepID=A0A8K1LP29_9PASS|nr:hypothetical protein HGM15179_006495 [Zosterops borbonicus]